MVYPLSSHGDTDPTKIFHVVTYAGEISENIARYFKKFNVNIAFKTEKNFQNLIRNNKSKTDKGNKLGVYIRKLMDQKIVIVHVQLYIHRPDWSII